MRGGAVDITSTLGRTPRGDAALPRDPPGSARWQLPVLLIGDRKLTGFNPAEIDAALKAAGR